LAYNTHLALAKESGNEVYINLTKIQRGYECEKDRKRRILENKLKNLRKNNLDNKKNNNKTVGVQHIPDFVINKSSVNFSEDEMGLLNKGLNYVITPSSVQKEDIIIDVESSAKYLPQEQKEDLRRTTKKAIVEIEDNRSSFKEEYIVKQLQRKPVYYLKADKGNSVVIMDKNEYDQKVMEKLTNENYHELRKDPLTDSITSGKSVERMQIYFG
jgi:hypothetical protein